MSGDPNRVAGVCSGLPLGIQDLMWGTDNERVRNKSDRRILKSTARILCDMCPIQAECLAQSIIGREQHSRIGGIDVKARRLLRHRAEADGVDLDPSNPARTRNLTYPRPSRTRPRGPRAVIDPRGTPPQERGPVRLPATQDRRIGATAGIDPIRASGSRKHNSKEGNRNGKQ